MKRLLKTKDLVGYILVGGFILMLLIMIVANVPGKIAFAVTSALVDNYGADYMLAGGIAFVAWTAALCLYNWFGERKISEGAKYIFKNVMIAVAVGFMLVMLFTGAFGVTIMAVTNILCESYGAEVALAGVAILMSWLVASLIYRGYIDKFCV